MDQDEKFPLQGKQEKSPKRGVLGLIVSPFKWVKKLSDELHWSFVLGVIQFPLLDGEGGRTSSLLYSTIKYLLHGSTAVLCLKYERSDHLRHVLSSSGHFEKLAYPQYPKPCQQGCCLVLWISVIYHIVKNSRAHGSSNEILQSAIACMIGAISMITLSLENNIYLGFALLLLICGSAGAAVADVTIDACVTENSIGHPSLAGEMQSLCGLCSSVGQLIGYTISGFLVHMIGSKGVFGVLSIPSGLVILVGMIIQEPLIRNCSYKRVSQKFLDAGKAMWMALKCPVIWRPCLYMYLSLSVSLHIHEGMFYWYTDAKNGPSFSKEAVGSISALGAVGSLLGVLLYQNAFRSHPFRRVLFWAQLLYGASGMLDLILVLRINLLFGVPDYALVVFDAAVSHMIGRLKWLPLLVLSSKLCPSGIEGTFFALLMSIDHVGSFTASWAGGLLLHSLNVTRTTFDNLCWPYQ
ncbi:UNVERIFIED_CONTAM: putative folate-biopterin transporter 3 [Sesamum calycinum]|uniref:Folate-biopterin transporter 3 n=1 Tax=Sesamum calycinum TaxID=2727403 RepID=A0AAW2SXK4_9LAMI